MSFISDMENRDLAILQALDGREVTYIANDKEPRTISGLFQQFSETKQGESVDIIGAQPILSVRSSDIPEIANGDKFTIDNTTYKVTVILPDSEGMTEIIMEKL
jgi:hypothetical protein